MRDDSTFVLRLWRDGSEADAWRASLTDVRTRDVQRFAGLEALTTYLNEHVARKSAQGPAKSGPDGEE